MLIDDRNVVALPERVKLSPEREQNALRHQACSTARPCLADRPARRWRWLHPLMASGLVGWRNQHRCNRRACADAAGCDQRDGDQGTHPTPAVPTVPKERNPVQDGTAPGGGDSLAHPDHGPRTISRRSVAFPTSQVAAQPGWAWRPPAPRRQPSHSSRATSGTAVASAQSLVVVACRAPVQLQGGDFLGGELVQVPGLLLDPDELGLVFEQRLREPVRQVVVHRPVDHQ
jgi:hypothetical protein